LCLAALVAAESAASAAVASRPLRAAAFTTRVPAGWPVVAFTDDASVYRIRSPATRFDPSGIQRPGGVGEAERERRRDRGLAAERRAVRGEQREGLGRVAGRRHRVEQVGRPPRRGRAV